MLAGEHHSNAYLRDDCGPRRLGGRLAARFLSLPLAAQLLLASGLVLVPLWAVLLLEMRRHEADSRRVEEGEVVAMAVLGAELLRAQAHAADQLLIQLRELWPRDRDAFRKLIQSYQAQSAPAARFEVAVVDADGRLAFSSVMPSAVGTDFSTRPVFSAHRREDLRGLRIGEPMWGHLAQRIIVPFSRSLRGESGGFLGVIVLPFQVDYLAESFEKMQLPPGWQISAVHDGGALMFHAIASPAADGDRSTLQLDRGAASPDEPVRRPGSPMRRGLPAEGSGVVTSRLDGTRRLYGWRRAGAYPLTLAVGKPEAEIAERLLAARRPTIFMGLASSSLVLTGVYWLLLLLRGRMAQVEELRRRQVELSASQNELKALNVTLQQVREEEDARIAREIHDELGQRLTMLRMDVSMLPRLVQTDPAGLLPSQVQALKAAIDDVIGIVRDISSRLRPAVLDAGLAEAVSELADSIRSSFGVAVRLDSHLPSTPLGDAITTAAYRIVQEAATNAVRHSQASRIDIRLKVDGTELSIEVADDGRGFQAGTRAPNEGVGLASMRERAAALGGALDLDSRLGTGTTVRARLPLRGAKAAQAPGISSAACWSGDREQAR